MKLKYMVYRATVLAIPDTVDAKTQVLNVFFDGEHSRRFELGRDGGEVEFELLCSQDDVPLNKEAYASLQWLDANENQSGIQQTPPWAVVDTIGPPTPELEQLQIEAVRERIDPNGAEPEPPVDPPVDPPVVEEEEEV